MYCSASFVLSANYSWYSLSFIRFLKLRYDYNALNPIDAETMMIHHSKHHQHMSPPNKALEGKSMPIFPLKHFLSMLEA